MARIVFSSAGFWGDVMPYVPIANELARRGHEVTYSLPAAHHDVLGGELFALHDNRSSFTHHDVLADPAQLEMLDKQQGSTTGTALVRYWAKKYVADEAEQWTSATADALHGADLLVTHPTAATLSAIPAQANGTPWVVGHLFPSMIPSRYTDPAGLDLSRLPDSAARALRRVAWRTVPTLASSMMQDRAINAVRSRYGLPSTRGNMMVAWMDADATAVLSSPRYTPPAPDWPDRVVMTGFTPWPGPAGAELAPEVVSYLESGAPPVLVTMGTSTATIAGPMLRGVALALERLDVRGVFLVGTRENERALDGIAGVFRFAPLAPVLERCRAVIHQGGHGTVTATLHAGLPSVALPMGFDQIVHGRRLQQLGIGTMVPARSRSTDRLAEALQDIIDDETTSRAREFAGKLRSEDGVTAASDLIERTLDASH